MKQNKIEGKDMNSSPTIANEEFKNTPQLVAIEEIE